MTARTIGIVDYGAGNLTSVRETLRTIGYRCRSSSDPAVLDDSDVLILPGVGAFPAAMDSLAAHGLVDYLQARARENRPIIGICLGMQLMLDVSSEHRQTAGLGLIPGEVSQFDDIGGHIGWNTLEVTSDDPTLASSDGQSVYFNHSYAVKVPLDYQTCVSRHGAAFTAGIRRGNVIGFQFHPEKSQLVGRQLLRSVIQGVST